MSTPNRQICRRSMQVYSISRRLIRAAEVAFNWLSQDEIANLIYANSLLIEQTLRSATGINTKSKLVDANNNCNVVCMYVYIRIFKQSHCEEANLIIILVLKRSFAASNYNPLIFD